MIEIGKTISGTTLVPVHFDPKVISYWQYEAPVKWSSYWTKWQIKRAYKEHPAVHIDVLHIYKSGGLFGMLPKRLVWGVKRKVHREFYSVSSEHDFSSDCECFECTRGRK